MKELAEIERGYIKDIIEFFCRKSFEIFGKNFLKSNSHDIISWIENHIKKMKSSKYISNLLIHPKIIEKLKDMYS